MNKIKVWAFYRPYCSPTTGQVFAKTGKEAIRFVNRMYGSATGTTVYCAETEETIKEENK